MHNRNNKMHSPISTNRIEILRFFQFIATDSRKPDPKILKLFTLQSYIHHISLFHHCRHFSNHFFASILLLLLLFYVSSPWSLSRNLKLLLPMVPIVNKVYPIIGISIPISVIRHLCTTFVVA